MSTFHETAQRTAGHIRQPFTLQEIADQIETGEYNAELMLQHLLLCTDSLQRENAALREDQERLDWLTNSLGWVIVGYPEADPSDHATEDNTLADAWRAAIDAARAKGAKP